MKNIIIYLLLLLHLSVFAQTTSSEKPEDFLGKISLSVVIEDNADRLTQPQLSKLQSKVLSIASRNGVAGTGYNSNFAMYPKFEIYDEAPVEGMRTVQVVTIELNLFIKQVSNNMVFSSYNRTIKGSGFDKGEAINNAISQINSNDPKAKAFIEEGKNKIIAYYNSKCNDIISEADKYYGMNNFEHSLAILMSVPVEATPCYDKIKTKSIEVFKKYQQKQCQQQLQVAKSQIAGNNFLSGLNTLAWIDPTSTCYNEAKTLIANTESKLDAHIKTEWQKTREIMKDRLEIEKMQIQAMRDITVAYYNRKPEVRQSIFMFIN